jgi:hypothetical protein
MFAHRKNALDGAKYSAAHIASPTNSVSSKKYVRRNQDLVGAIGTSPRKPDMQLTVISCS